MTNFLIMKINTAIGRGRKGSTLIELMVSLFIVAIVMLGWWRIFNATSPYREAQRRAAVEIGAGLLDILPEDMSEGEYRYNANAKKFDVVHGQRNQFPNQDPHNWFPSESPVRYVLTVERVNVGSADWRDWAKSGNFNYWAKLDLYDGEDTTSYPDAFKTLEQLIRVK